MSFTEIAHPPSSPPWLDHWLTESQISGRFSPSLRQTSLLVMRNERQFVLRWTADSLQADIGRITVTWRLTGEEWQPSCPCGYPGPACMHAYAAHVLLRTACRDRGWKMPGTATAMAARPASMATGQAPPARPRQLNLGRELFQDQPGAGHHDQAPESMRLEVEIDTRLAPGQFGVRFYIVRGEDRFLATLSAVRNHAATVAQQPGRTPAWGRSDADFLVWLLPMLRRLSRPQLSLRALALPDHDLSRWLNRWSAQPRFIDRETRDFINSAGLTTSARLVVELTGQGEWIQVAAVFVFANGRRLQAHELLLHLQNCPASDPIRGMVSSFEPPISWPTLREFFRQKSPRMGRQYVVEHLAELIDGRLDLISGDCVTRVETEASDLHLQVSQKKQQFILRFEHQGRFLDLDGGPCSDTRICEHQGGFLVTVYGGGLFAWVQDLRTRLLARGATVEDGELRLPAIPMRAAELRQLWTETPAGVRKTHAGDLAGLLGQNNGGLDRPRLQVRSQQGLVSMSVSWQVGQDSFSLAEVQEARRSGRQVLQGLNGSWFYLDPERLHAAADALAEAGLADGDPFLEHDAQETIKRLSRTINWQVEDGSRSFFSRLRTAEPPEPLRLPAELQAVLRPYQKAGVDFLADRCRCGAGAILADDMGLGKTLQVLAMLTAWKQQLVPAGGRFRVLVLCPASVIAVWQQQAQQFCPQLSVVALQGDRSTRAGLLRQEAVDVLVTHYNLARLDSDLLAQEHFTFVILDEAQAIKNPQAETTRTVKALRRDGSLALTGTPLENRLLDLWSIMDFLNPGYLGDGQTVSRLGQSPAGLARLTRRLAPVMLRRTKDLVAPELPPRTEQLLPIEMDQEQQAFYDRLLLQARQALRSQGPAAVLASLTRLRQACCAPELIRPGAREIPSAKLAALLENLTELQDSGHSCLVFSQFTGMLDIAARALSERGMTYFTITGETPVPRRQELVREFTECEAPSVFLLSLKAAGTGLTLTKADYVFLFDPWWNPAVERQAIDRTHRIGQDKAVFAYRLIVKNTVEEKVLSLLQQKRELFERVMDGAAEWAPETGLSLAELRSLLE
ncbi:MAG: DEAD/DEAH box helicase [Lentisphaeria bacterium]|nr:DEAD/DEAH box helicase [Lentisphaeria bacterium]